MINELQQRQERELQAAQEIKARTVEKLMTKSVAPTPNQGADPTFTKRLPIDAKSEGFTETDLAKEEKEAFLKYCKKHL